ncbi:MAG: hypothetical protein U1E98_02205 [Moraxella osloensis]
MDEAHMVKSPEELGGVKWLYPSIEQWLIAQPTIYTRPSPAAATHREN